MPVYMGYWYKINLRGYTTEEFDEEEERRKEIGAPMVAKRSMAR